MKSPGIYVSLDLEARAKELGINATVDAELTPGSWVLITTEGWSPVRFWIPHGATRLNFAGEAQAKFFLEKP